jgi:hypothetical protein
MIGYEIVKSYLWTNKESLRSVSLRNRACRELVEWVTFYGFETRSACSNTDQLINCQRTDSRTDEAISGAMECVKMDG